MKKVRNICLYLMVMILFTAFTTPVRANPDTSVSAGCHSVDALVPLDGMDPLLDSAKSVILYERNSETMIYAYYPDEHVDPSSMAKLMTALLAVEKLDLQDTATVSRSALDHVGIGVVSVKPRFSRGEVLTIESLLHCMMAASDSDSAAVLAEHIAGSQEAFVTMMNQRAAELGCTNTKFTNAHGLYDENAYSTARDICRILDAALDNEVFYKIFTAKSYIVPATNKAGEREVLTTNWMMSKDYTTRYFDTRVTGGKTGTDGNGGRCLAVTAEDNGMQMLAIVMGAQPVYNEEDPNILDSFGSFEEMKVLLDRASENFEFRQVFYKNQTFSYHPVSGGTNYVVTTPATEASAVLPIGVGSDQLRWVYGTAPDSLTAPVAQGEKISYLEVWYGNLCIAQTELLAMNAVDVYVAPSEPDAQEPLIITEGGTAIIIILVGVVAGFAVLFVLSLFAVRLYRIRALRARRRRRHYGGKR